MKVCLLNDSFPPVIDGVANTVMNYAEVLSGCSDDVIVGTPKYPDTDYSGYPYKVVPYQSFNTSRIVNGYRAGNPFSAPAIEELGLFKPDIIHTHCPFSSTVMARILRNESDAPVIFTYHTKFDIDIATAVKGKLIREEIAKMMVDNVSACDEVWTVSHGAGENLKSLGYEGEYRVVNNGVDFAKGRVPEEKVALVKEPYDIPDNVPVYLFVGRIMKYKGLPIIIDALKLLSLERKDFRMIFVGGGTDKEEMQKMAVENGLSVDIKNDDGEVTSLSESESPGKVIFTGAEHDREVLRAWNTLADLFLFPSTYDTNGIVVREAAACGLASVLIKDSCAAEGITDGVNGYIIDETSEAMAALLSKIGNDRDKLRSTGQHAMDEIYISWNDAVRDARERYEEIIEIKKSGNLLPVKKDTSHYILEAASALIDSSNYLFSIPHSIKEGMMENLTEAKEEFQMRYEEMQFKYEELQGKYAEFRKALKEGAENLRKRGIGIHDETEDV